MRDQIRALAKLAEIDASARGLDKELTGIPAHLEALRADVNRLEQLLAMERDQLADAERLKAAHGAEAMERNEALARAKAKGAKARNAREAEAAEREVEAVRRSIRDREEETAKFLAAIEKVRASLAEHETEFSALRTMLADEETKGRARIAELETARSKVLEGRGEIVAKLPDPLVRKYERIREKRSGVGVAEVADGACQACRVHVTPQFFLQVQRGEALEQCPSCLRLLYHRGALLD